MMPSLEVWATIEDCPNYEVSTFGRIRRCRAGQRTRVGKILAPGVNSWGYQVHSLSIKNRRVVVAVHRLVAKAFLRPQPTAEVVAHRDGDKLNNFVGNLRWSSQAANYADSVGHGTNCRGERHGRAILTDDVVREIRRSFSAGASRSEIGKRFQLGRTQVHKIIHRETWRHVT